MDVAKLCQAFLVAVLSTLHVPRPSHSVSDNDRAHCYVVCDEACAISRGPSFAASRRILGTNSTGVGERSNSKIGPDTQTTLGALRALTVDGRCPSAVDDPPDACVIEWRPNQGRADGRFAIVSRGYGERRTIVFEDTREQAQRMTSDLADVGQCRRPDLD